MKAHSQVQMVAHWVIPSPPAVSIAAALQAVMMATRQERGCVSCSLSTDVGDGVTFTYRATWETEHDLRRHVQSEHFTMFAGLLESASTEPMIEFALPCGSRGLEYAFEAREGRGLGHSVDLGDVRG